MSEITYTAVQKKITPSFREGAMFNKSQVIMIKL
jgi:hypothetical protein